MRPSGKRSNAAHAAVMVFPEPVADTSVARAPLADTDDLAGNPVHLRMLEFASTWCSRSWILSTEGIIPSECRRIWRIRLAPQTTGFLNGSFYAMARVP